MSESDDKPRHDSGIFGQIRRLSRRFSGTILVDSKGPANLPQTGKKSIYSYDDDEQLRIGLKHRSISQFSSLCRPLRRSRG